MCLSRGDDCRANALWPDLRLRLCDPLVQCTPYPYPTTQPVYVNRPLNPFAPLLLPLSSPLSDSFYHSLSHAPFIGCSFILFPSSLQSATLRPPFLLVRKEGGGEGVVVQPLRLNNVTWNSMPPTEPTHYQFTHPEIFFFVFNSFFVVEFFRLVLSINPKLRPFYIAI